MSFLEAVTSLKVRAALTKAYAAGLRAWEAVSLKVTDIDSDRMVLQIRHGKGAKDRTVILRGSGSCGPITRNCFGTALGRFVMWSQMWIQIVWSSQITFNYSDLNSLCGGGGGIRTHGRLSPTSVFKTGAFDHSATPPTPTVIWRYERF